MPDIRMVPVLALVAMALVDCQLAESQPTALFLTCSPEYGLRDDRKPRPNYIEGYPTISTYYLFSRNTDIFEYRVGLISIEPEMVKISPDAVFEPGTLLFEIERDGIRLAKDQVDVVPARFLLGETIYLRDGEAIPDMTFKLRFDRSESEPMEPYEERRTIQREVDSLPGELSTYQEAIVVFRLVGRDGSPLPRGLYSILVSHAGSGKECMNGRQLIVLREPETSLDLVEEHIARSNYHRAKGDLTAVAQELSLATRLAPNSLKGWVHFASFAYQSGDLEGRAMAAAEAARILTEQNWRTVPGEEGYLQQAREMAESSPRLARELAER